VTAFEDLANRLRKNARHFGKWARRRGIQAYRVYDRDIPEFAFALDVYGARAHLQEYDRALRDERPEDDGWLLAARDSAAEALNMAPADVTLKRRTKRHGREQHEKTGAAGEDFVVEEGGHRFIVNLQAYLDTGLFLDHRTTRMLVQSEARGRRVLNLFCYTGSFTVYAVAGGAVSSLSVDLSNTYLDWARRNLALNGVDSMRHRLERADVLSWLADASSRGAQRFDLIVLDPPSFSASKAMRGTLDVQRDHLGLLNHCAQLLAPGGVLYFSTNLRSFRFDPAAACGLHGEEITARTIPEDFRNRRIHRCWRFLRP
jgi:23S rRNA (cytosine1962-C5)-methyltransferase